MNSFCTTAEYSVETVSRNFKMPSMHYHNAYELYYLEAGSRDYFVEDKIFSVSAGEFVLIPPGKLHRTGGAYCVRTLVHFTLDFFERIFTPAVAEQLVACFSQVKISPGQKQQQCKDLLVLLSGTTNETEFGLLLGQLLLLLAKCGNQEIQYDQVSRIVAFINQNYASIHTIDQIAEVFFVSKYHLCRMFKKSMQVTIIDYLNEVRLKHARHLLEQTDRDVGDIAILCGFNSVAYFSNVFKRNTGVSPSVFRKQRNL